jgi:hypothetical protein
MRRTFKVGEQVLSYSSVGEQVVTILEVDLKVQNPFSGEWTENMVMVQYHVKPGRGLAHENQLRRIPIERIDQ